MNNPLPTITEISVIPIPPKDGHIGFASLTFDGRIRLNNIAIYTNIKNGGFRLSYPTKEIITGKSLYLYFPVNRETGDLITKAVSAELEKLIKKY